MVAAAVFDSVLVAARPCQALAARFRPRSSYAAASSLSSRLAELRPSVGCDESYWIPPLEAWYARHPIGEASISMTSAVIIGASGGIGRALVTAITAADCYKTVFALSRKADYFPDPIRSETIDITDERSVAAAARNVGNEGPVGLVVIASGILHGEGISPEKAIRALDPAAMAAVFAVNAIGPTVVAKHFLPLMPRSERCVFAALSARVGSIADNRLGGWYTYRASKAALNQILRTLSIETARTHSGAIIVGLHPGTVRTALSQPFRPDDGAPGLFTPEQSAAHLMRVLGQLTDNDSGKILAWDGSPIPS